MRDWVTELTGYGCLAAATALASWEALAYARRKAEDWLATRHRLTLRLFIAAVLGGIGVLLALHGRGALATHSPAAFGWFALGLMGLTVLLVVLSIADVMQTARRALMQAAREFDDAAAGPKKPQPPPSSQS